MYRRVLFAILLGSRAPTGIIRWLALRCLAGLPDRRRGPATTPGATLGRLIGAAALIWTLAGLQPAHAVAPRVERTVIETPVQQLAHGLRERGLLAVSQWPQVRGIERLMGRSIVRADALLLELQADDVGVRQLDRLRLIALGATPLAMGSDSWLAWVPLEALQRLASLPGLGRVRLPVPLRARLGPQLSKGATASGATARHCQGQRGAGVQVAVVDEEWSGFSPALAQGELAEVQGKAPYQGSDPEAWHGTACAEIAADMAPAAVIRPLQLATLAELQAQLPKLLAAGVQVISQSSGWTSGYSFGDGGGKACELVATASKGGLAWVAAAGNEGGGHQWRGAWSDTDGDGWLEFSSDDQGNGFYAQGGTLVALELDWNAYPATAVDLDLHLCANQFGACQSLAASQGLQSGTQSPIEAIWWDVTKSGTYFLRVFAKKAPPAGLALRLVGQGTGPLQHHTKAGTIVDPAACTQAIAVGAAEATTWNSNSIADYSARGPTFDGRVKPELLAPTAVQVSVTQELFEGTSAATPHAAGALAVLLGQGLETDQAIAELLGQTDNHGLTLPDNLRGHGWLQLQGPAVGCLPELTDSAACTSICGTPGQSQCADPCAAVTCAPLGEACPAPVASDAATGNSDSADGSQTEIPKDSPDVQGVPAAANGPSEGGCQARASASSLSWGWLLLAGLGLLRRQLRSASHQPAAPPSRQDAKVTAA